MLISRRKFVCGGAMALASEGLYASEISRHECMIVENAVTIRSAGTGWHGRRIVQISDIHLHAFTEEWFLAKIVKKINELQPDVVLVTGDFITGGTWAKWGLSSASTCAEILSEIKCPYKFGCIGNHEVNVGAKAVLERLKPSGLQMLVNESAIIGSKGDELCIVGLDQASVPEHPADYLRRFLPARQSSPLIVMLHEPDMVDQLLEVPFIQNVDLIVSGHSHGGQIRFPGLAPLWLPIGAEKYYEGAYRFDQVQLYVNRGIGSINLPLRLFCPPEITVHTLRISPIF